MTVVPGKGARDIVVLGWALLTYRRSVLPAVRRELRCWEDRAAAIPDPTLRAHALGAIREKGSNAEATAVFAILVGGAQRQPALRAMTALQVAIDYLDSVSEEPADEPLANGLALHGALGDALGPAGEEKRGWYDLRPGGDDGGYLAALVEACRHEVEALPGWTIPLATAARSAARRCGEGQSHTHAAAAAGSSGELRGWAERQPAPPGYRWWEIAAGASSSVAAHALIAAAADPRSSREQAELIDAAYFPPLGALTVLLDDLVDRERDRAAGEHSYLDYYAGAAEAASRLAFLAERAKAALAPLPHAARHRAILAGVAGFYLAAPSTRGGYGAPIRERLLESLKPTVWPVLTAMRLRGRG